VPRPFLDEHVGFCSRTQITGVGLEKSWGLTVVASGPTVGAGLCWSTALVNCSDRQEGGDHMEWRHPDGAGPERHRCHQNQQDGRPAGPSGGAVRSKE